MLKALLLLCYLFCGHVGPLGCFFSAPFDLASGLLRTVRKTPYIHETRGPTSVRKVALTVFCRFCCYEHLLQWAVKFGACLRQSSAILVHS